MIRPDRLGTNKTNTIEEEGWRFVSQFLGTFYFENGEYQFPLSGTDNAFFEHAMFYRKNEQFTKTGSGQTSGNSWK